MFAHQLPALHQAVAFVIHVASLPARWEKSVNPLPQTRVVSAPAITGRRGLENLQPIFQLPMSRS